MRSALIVAMTLLTLAGPVYAADDVASAVAGSVKKVDSATKTLVVKTDDGAEHTFHFTEKVSVHGAKDVSKTPKETLDGVKEGSRVAIHYTAIGGKDTAREVDVIGNDGLKVTEGTVTHIDRGAKFLVVKTGKGSEETFQLTDRAAKDSGKDIGKGAEQSAKVTVYYTDEAGKKVVHFFR